MIGYKIPCRYCDVLVDPNASVCPMCGKVNPAGPLRCPKCRNPVRKQWTNCSGCGLVLKVACGDCGEETFFGDYCDHCEARLVVTCPHPKCGVEQPPLGDMCSACGKPLQE